MKKLRINSRLLGLLALLTMLMLAMSVSAAAKDANVIKNLPVGKWTTIKGTEYDAETNSYTRYYYKFTLRTDCRLTFQLAGSDSACVCVCDSRKNSAACMESGSTAFVLCKGTYYLLSTGTVKVRYTCAKAVNKPNYSMGTAVTLKKGSTVRICNTRDHGYERWYKIKMTSPGYLKITAKEASQFGTSAASTDVYAASQMEMYMVEKSKFTTVSDGRLPAGTYYIRVICTCDYTSPVGQCITMSWTHSKQK